MADTKLFQFQLKERGFIRAFRQEAVGKHGAVVRLDTFNEIRELFHNMTQEDSRGIGAVFLKSFDIPKAVVLVQEGILKPLCGLRLVHNTRFRDKFHIDLNTLAGILHLLIGLGNVLGVRQFYGHGATFSQETIQPGNGSGVTSLPELDPQYNDPGIRVTAAHIQDKLDFFRCVLVWMMMRPVRAVCQRFECTVVPLAPTVDILPVQSITNRCRSDTVFVRILITACLKRMVCVILFMANRVTPAFWFGLDNLTVTQVSPIRYLFLSFVTHHCNTYSYRSGVYN